MSTYSERKNKALTASGVSLRDDGSLPVFNASDQFSHHSFPNGYADPPLHIGAYAPKFRLIERPRLQFETLATGSSAQSSAAPFGDPRELPRPRIKHVFEAPVTPNAQGYLGLHLVDSVWALQEIAPDNSKYVLTNFGDLGRAFSNEV